MNIKQDIREILRKHYKHPNKLELNDAYLVLHKELVEYMQNNLSRTEKKFLRQAIDESSKGERFKKRLKDKLGIKEIKSKPCEICQDPIMPNKYGKYRKTCSDECKSELFSRNAANLVKEGRTKNGWRV